MRSVYMSECDASLAVKLKHPSSYAHQPQSTLSDGLHYMKCELYHSIDSKTQLQCHYYIFTPTLMIACL